MSRIGVDVPPGFTLTTPLCKVFEQYCDLPVEIWDEIKESVKRVEADMGKKYGDTQNPLLFSCRSGAAVSMPGMMDTVLNIGLNSVTVEGLAKATGNPRFAYDAFRRLLQMYGDVVLGISHHNFEKRLEAIKEEAGVWDDVDLSADYLKLVCEEFKKVYTENNKVFPEDPYDQLFSCVKAVFGSWMAGRAIKYREINGIGNLIGTACNIQTMVFGNMGETSGTGVAFSRDPGTGENLLYGEYLINAQGEVSLDAQHVLLSHCLFVAYIPNSYNSYNLLSLSLLRMLLLGSELPSQYPEWLKSYPRPTANLSVTSRNSRSTSKICKTSNSRLKMESFGCFSVGPANALAKLPFKLPSIW